jgi:exonuclease VII small subunit
LLFLHGAKLSPLKATCFTNYLSPSTSLFYLNSPLSYKTERAMGDPLSVAGTAVGIISLGLTVCNTIVSYGCAYRAFDEDIQNLKSKAESLGENLEILKGAIEYTRTAEPETAIVLSNKVIRIKRVLVRLDGKIKRYGPSVSPESLARKTFKKTTYPFRKDDFRDLVADLDSVQDDLQAALAMYVRI